MAGPSPFLSPIPTDLISEYMFGRRRQVNSANLLFFFDFAFKISMLLQAVHDFPPLHIRPSNLYDFKGLFLNEFFFFLPN